MKYIRTKDGKILKCKFEFMILTPNIVYVAHEDKIIKRSDTIEELCDEFIWNWNKGEYPYSTSRQYTRYSFGEVKREMIDQLNYGKNINLDYKVYGAIWTDKGLIYVAKLNEKGELELI